MEEMNRLTQWVIRKVEKEYKDDVALLIGLRGHNTDNDQHAVSFDYFVPATQRGNGLAETFIIGGVGHDLYPRSWERLEDSVLLNDLAIVLDQAVILYARSKEDEDRFLNLKQRLHNNLRDAEFVFEKALEYMDKALEVYKSLVFEEELYRVRCEAGYVHLFLSKAVAVLNHTYTESPILSVEQARDEDPDSRIYHCPEMKRVPQGFYSYAKRLMKETDPEKVKKTVFLLLKSTRRFILDAEPKRPSQGHGAADFRALADWYRELSLTWRRIRYFCRSGMAEQAYIDAGYLQEELLSIAEEYGIAEMDLLSAFDPEDLSKLAERSDFLEKRMLATLKEHGITIQSYATTEDFLKARA